MSVTAVFIYGKVGMYFMAICICDCGALEPICTQNVALRMNKIKIVNEVMRIYIAQDSILRHRIKKTRKFRIVRGTVRDDKKKTLVKPQSTTA